MLISDKLVSVQPLQKPSSSYVIDYIYKDYIDTSLRNGMIRRVYTDGTVILIDKKT